LSREARKTCTKEEALKWINHARNRINDNSDQREYYNERAAIYEYCAGMSREQAEKRAMDDMKRKFY
jgi:hypothetical protein